MTISTVFYYTFKNFYYFDLFRVLKAQEQIHYLFFAFCFLFFLFALFLYEKSDFLN
jgi:hypothetical protein